MAPAWMPAYVGLGSNLDDPRRQLLAAFEALARLDETRLLAVSSLYGSAPMGPPGQPDYVNAAAGMLTTLAPEEFLSALQAVEKAHGRRRDGERWGPRILDLDLLGFGNLTRRDDDLVLPHPGIPRRPFVIVPLAEIAPGLRLPGLPPVAAMARSAARDELWMLEAA
ncbi:MAG: 2-amino-4-hydroxy-6-hydroxymethyldihydropteridine diphosphokinase [Gammaproteobacteria bacterium]